MPDGRPEIPAKTKRLIREEAGYRCCRCGSSEANEFAHIVPWAKTKSHTPDNLILLCANCHTVADNEKWGINTFLAYKKRPYIDRVKNDEDIVTLVIPGIKLKHFGPRGAASLLRLLEKTLHINPAEIEIIGTDEGSVLVAISASSYITRRIQSLLPAKALNSLGRRILLRFWLTELIVIILYIGCASPGVASILILGISSVITWILVLISLVISIRVKLIYDAYTISSQKTVMGAGRRLHHFRYGFRHYFRGMAYVSVLSFCFAVLCSQLPYIMDDRPAIQSSDLLSMEAALLWRQQSLGGFMFEIYPNGWRGSIICSPEERRMVRFRLGEFYQLFEEVLTYRPVDAKATQLFIMLSQYYPLILEETAYLDNAGHLGRRTREWLRIHIGYPIDRAGVRQLLEERELHSRDAESF